MKERTIQFDFEILQQHLDDMQKSIETAAGKDVVIVIGNIGSGRSSTISHLIGNIFDRDKISGNAYVTGWTVPEENSPPIAMKKGTSKTLYPHAYCNSEQSDLVFVEFPGFGASREIEIQLALTVAMKRIIPLVKSIQGIIIVMSGNEMGAVKGTAIKNLFTTLNRIFSNIELIEKSTLFLMSKKPLRFENDYRKTAAWKEKLIIPFFKSLSAHILEKSHEAEDTATKKRLQRKHTIVHKLVKHPEKIEIIDITDKGFSRRALLTKIAKLKTLNKYELHFHQQDKVRRQLNQAFTCCVDQFAKIIDDIKKTSQDYANCQLEIGKPQSMTASEKPSTLSYRIARTTNEKIFQHEKKIAIEKYQFLHQLFTTFKSDFDFDQNTLKKYRQTCFVGEYLINNFLRRQSRKSDHSFWWQKRPSPEWVTFPYDQPNMYCLLY